MSEFSIERHKPAPGDAREQYLVTEREGKYVIDRFIVVGDEEYARGVVRTRIERAKRAPIRYPNNGVF